MSILVTGGAGFIGCNFVRFWGDRHPGDEIIVLDALTYAANIASLDGTRSELVHGDIRDAPLVERLLVERDISTIVHFAAESHVDRSISGPDAFIDANIIGSHTLLKAARAAWLDKGSGKPHRFHHISTDEVYGTLGTGDPAFSETTPYAPNSPYSASKAASDHLVRAYHHTYGLQTTTSNCSNNYGPFQFPEKLMPLFLLNALSGASLPIYGDGCQIRDWLHVADHCLAIALILESDAVGETFNVGGGAELPNIEVIDKLCALVDRLFLEQPSLRDRFPDAPPARGQATATLKTYVVDRPGHDRRYAIDERKISERLGYRPTYRFEDGLAETVQWYLDHEPWWRSVQTGAYRDWISRNYERRF